MVGGGAVVDCCGGLFWYNETRDVRRGAGDQEGDFNNSKDEFMLGSLYHLRLSPTSSISKKAMVQHIRLAVNWEKSCLTGMGLDQMEVSTRLLY